jgi:hypothetical protein
MGEWCTAAHAGHTHAINPIAAVARWIGMQMIGKFVSLSGDSGSGYWFYSYPLLRQAKKTLHH